MAEASEVLMSVLSTIRVPRPGDRVHKDECALSFATPVSSSHLPICLRSFSASSSGSVRPYILSFSPFAPLSFFSPSLLLNFPYGSFVPIANLPITFFVIKVSGTNSGSSLWPFMGGLFLSLLSCFAIFVVCQCTCRLAHTVITSFYFCPS